MTAESAGATADPVALLEQAGVPRLIESGSTLYSAGDTSDALFLIVSGRMRIVAEIDGEARTVRESGPGDLIGTLGVYTDQPRSSTAIAVRDSELRCIPREEFAALMAANPAALWRFGQLCLDNVRQRYQDAGSRNREGLHALALIPGHEDLPVAHLGAILAAELGERGACAVLGPAQVDAALGPGTAATPASDEAGNARIAAWLSDQEHAHRYLLYVGEAGEDSCWNRRCLRQADRLLVVARPDRPARLPGDLSEYLAAPVHAPVECVYLNDSGPGAPLTPWAWREACGAEMHHWVDPDARAPLARLARMLCGEAVGVVLGGGGARGFAHVGLLRALAERELTVDLWGGTSMGALIAASAALGRGAEEVEELLRELFLRHNNLNDYVVPRVSLIAARKLRRRIEVAFGSARIELLPQPFFCVTTNITRGESLVHERGPLAHWVGASMSVPGIAPPVAYQGDLLVDGAILNNVPADVMRRYGRGPVIAADVTAAENLDIPGTEAGAQEPRQLRRQGRQPNIFKILFRSATLLSPELRRMREASADLYLHMPIAGIGMFDWELIDQIIDDAYDYSSRALDAWLENRS